MATDTGAMPTPNVNEHSPLLMDTNNDPSTNPDIIVNGISSLPDQPTATPNANAAPMEEKAKKPKGGPKRGRKNGRFGGDPGEPASAPKKQDRSDERKSEWGRFLHKWKTDHPKMDPLEATIEARKRYVPSNGKAKSLERMFIEVWKARHPHWKLLTKEDKEKAIRKTFIDTIGSLHHQCESLPLLGQGNVTS